VDAIGLTLCTPHPTSTRWVFSHGVSPKAKGTYRGHVVEAYVNYTESVFEVELTVQPRVGDPLAQGQARAGRESSAVAHLDWP
jgi:hypothetical protein